MMRVILFLLLAVTFARGAADGGYQRNPWTTNYIDGTYNLKAGLNHSNSGSHSIVAAGAVNTNLGIGSVIGGGATNRNEPPWSVIAGGRNNSILGTGTSNDVCTISGGEDNVIELGNVKHVSIGGGQRNRAKGGAAGARYGTIGGGWDNIIAYSNSVVSGGYSNRVFSRDSNIGGGYNNYIGQATNIPGFGTPAGGGAANTIGGGGSNYIYDASYSAISGGQENAIYSDPVVYLEGSWIGGGLRNIIRVGYAVIPGGFANVIGIGGDSSVLSGGFRNIQSGAVAVIGGGQDNTNGAIYSAIGGGLQNRATTAADYAIIPGGTGNTVSGASSGAIGNRNTVTGGGSMAFGYDLNVTEENVLVTGMTDATSIVSSYAGTKVNGALGEAPAAIVTLTADDQQVFEPVAASYVRIQGDGGGGGLATARTIVLSYGSFAGQTLDIEWVGTNAGQILDNGALAGGVGNIRLNGDWTPTQYDVLSLRFNGTDWVERSRSAN